MSDPLTSPVNDGRASSGADEGTPLYRLAYEEGQRALDDQLDEMNLMRGRAVQFMAFVGSSTAFLAAFGLRDSQRSFWFFATAVLASALSGVVIWSVSRLLSPRLWSLTRGDKESGRKLAFRLSAGVLVDEWIRAEVPKLTEAAMLEGMALEFDEMRKGNLPHLQALRRLYGRTIVLGSCAVIFWAVLAWIGGNAP